MEAGQYIDGRYKIIRAIGSGGMSNVYLATDLILERDVAIKVLRYDFRDDAKSVRRFEREAHATIALNHQHIVQVYDVGEDENPYIVMEYVSGPNLKEYIDRDFPIPYPKVISIMNQILSGVHYAHEKNIIHRDLKPQNILMDKKDQAMITDFGIAVALSDNSITQTNSLLGSVQYISPEQARGSMASRQSDIYALGIILFQMLTKEVPFEGESAVSVALKHFQEEIPSLKGYDSNIPQPLENVVIKAMAKEPKNRYQTAEEMRQDLLTALDPDRQNEPLLILHQDHDEATKPIEPIKQDVAASSVTVKPDAKPIEKVEASEMPSEKKVRKKEKKPKRKWWIPLLVIALAVLALVSYLMMTQPDDIQIPDVRGLTQAEAVMMIEDLQLEIGEVIEESSEDYEEGQVTRTNPSVQSFVKEDSEINLYVSTGQELYAFPNVIGQNYEEIRAQLTDIGFTVEREDTPSSTYAEGEIINQSIQANEEVLPSETSVLLTVSSGEPTFSLRDLTNYSWRGVQDYAEERQLTLTRSDEYSDSIPTGQVISQKPASGTTLKAGDSLEVVISQGPEPEEEPEEPAVEDIVVNVVIPYEPVPTSSEEPTSSTSDNSSEDDSGSSSSSEPELLPNEIEIFVEDTKHSFEEPYRTMRITNNTTVQLSLTLEEGQTGRYRIVRNGETIEESEFTG